MAATEKRGFAGYFIAIDAFGFAIPIVLIVICLWVW